MDHDPVTSDFERWPIRFKRLFYDDDYTDGIRTPQKDQYGNLDGIFGRYHVAGWIYEIQERTNREIGRFPPVALLQLRHGMEGPIPEDIPYEKLAEWIDPALELDLMYKQSSFICSKHRENGCGREKCDRVDFSVVRWFLGRKREEIIEKERDSYEQLFRDYFTAASIEGLDGLDQIVIDVTVVPESKVFVLTYICPHTYLTEILIPIIINGRVVAVLLSGQLIVEDSSPHVSPDAIRIQCSRCFPDIPEKTKPPKKPHEDDFSHSTVSGAQYLQLIQLLGGYVKDFEAVLGKRVDKNTYSLLYHTYSDFSKLVDAHAHETVTCFAERALVYLAEHTRAGALAFYYELPSKRSRGGEHLLRSEQWFVANRDGEIDIISTRDRIPAPYKLDEMEKPGLLLYGPVNGYYFLGLPLEEATRILSQKCKDHPYLFLHIDDKSHKIDNLFYLCFPFALRSTEIEELFTLYQQVSAKLMYVLTARKIKQVNHERELVLRTAGHELSQQVLASKIKMDALEKAWKVMSTEIARQTIRWSTQFYEQRDKFRLSFADLQTIFEIITMQSDLLLSRTTEYIPKKSQVFFYNKVILPTFHAHHIQLRAKGMYYDYDQTHSRNPPLIVYGDPARLSQVMYNLLNNALKYGYDGTYIRLTRNKDQQDSDTTFVLENYGVGIPPEDLENVFKMGFRSEKQLGQYDGIGFGLSLVQDIMDEHDGSIACTSDKISDYNLPMVAAALKYNEASEEPPLTAEQVVELIELSQTLDEWKERKVVHTDIEASDERFTDDDILERVLWPTYHTKFTFTIPSQKKQGGHDRR